MKTQWDVIVIGGGSAAFESAVAARQKGADVVLIEKAPLDESGGNARYSHTGFRFAYSGVDEISKFLPGMDDQTLRRLSVPAYTKEDFVADLNHVTDGRIDPVLADTIASDSNEAVHWMRETGIEWELGHHVVIDDKLHFEPGIIIHPAGGGLGQLARWREIAKRVGVEVHYGTPMVSLLGTYGVVEGVRVSSGGREIDLKASNVILCAGGFQANQEMRARYLGENSDRMLVRGSRHNTGEVLQRALEFGARPSGHWHGAHATPLDAKAPRFEVPVRGDGMGSWTTRYYYMYGITVNKHGKRFYDEGETQHSYTYAKTGAAVLSQPGGIAFQIFDQKGIRLMKKHEWMHLECKHEACTLAELATKIGIDASALENTVAQYNAAIVKDRPYDPTISDGRHTVGLTPNKSNWSEEIVEKPFVAYPITGGITFTYGGLEIDSNGQVIGISGNPIRGLYAVGDITGIFYQNYPSCSGQTRNAVFARRVANHIGGA